MQSNQNKLLLALIIILGLAAGYIYYSQFSFSSSPVVAPLPISAKDDLKKFETLKINFSILDNAKYKSLEVFGESPVVPGVTGKKDIFAPF
ncbi:MAG: hypothetical protein A2736_00815 [Candidatus Yanofskybacteria bacterium RIFCSPHIGHO2_01_FULL_41_27]|uniref:Uncharacterized protein n=3 Tax=Parcubacteria group TaxID=1794811 RepID=A0A0G0ZSQ6_9BACT|nr:MAG: hypothetical protein UU83_C0011G0005 [Candidatus Jorgensenbacteria bacterium GW2011_GWF2_41_8]KKS26831.1 MAG: hypothetical protein UU84_C0015G0009 [Candidatus Yanofskybacteria bacterium GW2011_GWC2_41_9]OGN00300.1 MAG: hypothetical protein A2736_00815 [Candidatus Yanofskybacteria bacterium RIFCSPHIGHO2_01_FULL_41_27]OGN09641.1 MAG: hypothetical protein A3C64_01910 [Candidatus Yanofskybacteria bacterium RIFCSPHIGHO2_02_FULL_41_12]OGN19919.1 MAG: hypothetical protein A3B00_00240 [Candidat